MCGDINSCDLTDTNGGKNLHVLAYNSDLLEQDAVLNEVVLNLQAGDDAVSVYKTKSTIQYAGGFSGNIYWSSCAVSFGTGSQMHTD